MHARQVLFSSALREGQEKLRLRLEHSHRHPEHREERLFYLVRGFLAITSLLMPRITPERSAALRNDIKFSHI